MAGKDKNMRNEKWIEHDVEKYRDYLETKHESDVEDQLSDWISDQDVEPTEEEIEEKRAELTEELDYMINREVKDYRIRLEEEY